MNPSQPERRPQRWPVFVTALIALVIGFGAARVLGHSTATAPTPAPTAQESAPKKSGVDEVKIPADYLTAANIAVEAIGKGGTGTELLVPGTVSAPPGQEAVIVSRVSGTVQRVFRRLGDRVAAGETLALVESPDATTLASDHAVASARADLAKKSFEREARLFEQGVTARQDMESAQSALAVAQAEARRAAAAAQVARLEPDGRSVAVVSPIAGRITAQSMTLGAFVAPQSESFRVAASGAVQIEASITAEDLGQVEVSSNATVVLSNGSPIAATVRGITPTVSGSSRTATVVITPVETNGRLVVGEGVQVRLHRKADSTDALTIADEAVQNLDGRDVVFVRTGDGFRARPVLVGTRSGGTAQILSGVKAGDVVATRNAFLVKAEMNKGGDDE